MTTQLDEIKHIHMIAICGTGMGSLAGLLKEKGFQISGSDQNIYPPMSTELENLGVHLYQGYNAQNLSGAPDLVIVGNAVSKDNPEVVEMLRLGLPYMSMPQAIGDFFMPGKKSIVVSGTHGKTTTTALLAHVLTKLSADPSFLIGGILQGGEKNYRHGQGEYFIIEGDEYDTAFFDKGSKFLHYHPYYTLITSLEFDHADIFRDLDHLCESFVKLIGITSKEGRLIVCADGYDRLDKLAEEAAQHGRQVDRYGISHGDWKATKIIYASSQTHFEIQNQNNKPGANFLPITISSPLAGKHNVLNTLAVFVICHQLGFVASDISEAISTFPGVKRRQEVRGTVNDVIVIDDFAHHPTAVRETIEAIKERYPHYSVWAIFEPRSNSSKRDIFQKDYENCFDSADRVILADVFMPEKVKDGKILNVDKIIETLSSKNKKAVRLPNADLIVQEIKKTVQPKTVLLVMSNGGFDGIHDKILQSLT